MFWGLIMEPNKRYTQVVEKAFHISQAAMDISTGDNDPNQVMVVVEGKNFLVCTLQKNKTIQVPIDLYFRTGDSVSFLTNGKCNVHLTGYLEPELEDDMGEEEEDEEDEAPELPVAKNKRKLDTSNDGVANKKAKPDKKKGKKAAADDSTDSDNDKDQLRKFLEAEDIDTDEQDDSFKINASADDSDEDDSDEDEDDEDEEDDEDDDEEEVTENGDKDESSEEADTSMDTSKEITNTNGDTTEETKFDMSKLSKNQRRRLKKQQSKQEAAAQPQVNGVDKTKKDKQQKNDKKKEAKTEDPTPEKREKKNLSGGVGIEDLKVGTGAPAKPGKIVQVYYEGRLQSNNKMFDNCLKGPGFKFRLGSKEVIAGWDVGVAGMKVGGKRKIVCPPAMAYGAKGSPPVIPPNSTLVFEVELKNVK